jgi:alkanesulfonate monooxygenase SsuD/methylene tetrahydromethanopterin reductase-like flavin-dependent oxidoreductase (luciferase family)
MKVGILVETEEGLDWDHWRRTFAAAERLGFESVWISDHLQSAWTAGRHGLEPWTALTVAAAETHRIVFGSLVSPITFREPALVARCAESLDRLAPGRCVIGLGLGWNADEHAAAGIAFPPVQERRQRLNQGIERIRRELGERRIPILVGGKGPRSTLPIVAQHADEWNVTTASATEYARSAGELDRLCQEIGRDPGQIRRSVAVGFLIGRNVRELSERSERMRVRVKPLTEERDVLGAMRRMGWVVGTPQEIVSAVSPLAELWVDRVIFGHYDLEDVASLELLAERVMPKLA